MAEVTPDGQPAGTPAPGAAEMLAPGTAAPGAEHPAGAAPTPAPSGQPAVAPWAESGEGAWNIGDNPWYSTIPEEPVRQLMEAKAYKNPAELAMAYHNANKLINGSTDVVAVPGPDATPEAWDAFHKHMGRPDTVDGYDLKFGEDVQVDDNMLAFGKSMFHKLGLDNARAQEGANMWNTFIAEQNSAMAESFRVQNDTEVQALKDAKGDQFDAHLAAGRRVMEAAKISPETVAKVEASIGTAGVLELLGAIGSVSKEGSFVGAGDGGGDPTNPANMTAEQANKAIADLRNDKDFMKVYEDKNADGHLDAINKMAELMKRV